MDFIAFNVCRISPHDAVGKDGERLAFITIVVVHAPAVICRITAECAAFHPRKRIAIVYAASPITCVIAAEDTTDQCRGGAIVRHAAATTIRTICYIADECTVGQSRRGGMNLPHLVVHSASASAGAICFIADESAAF